MKNFNLNISISNDSRWNIKADADENQLSMVMDIIKLIMENGQKENTLASMRAMEKYDFNKERMEFERVLHRDVE